MFFFFEAAVILLSKPSKRLSMKFLSGYGLSFILHFLVKLCGLYLTAGTFDPPITLFATPDGLPVALILPAAALVLPDTSRHP